VQNDKNLVDAITDYLTTKGFLGHDEFLLLGSVRHWRIVFNGLVIRAHKVLPVMFRPGDLMLLSDGSIGFVLFSPHFGVTFCSILYFQ
jgi:hypothetical protein